MIRRTKFWGVIYCSCFLMACDSDSGIWPIVDMSGQYADSKVAKHDGGIVVQPDALVVDSALGDAAKNDAKIDAKTDAVKPDAARLDSKVIDSAPTVDARIDAAIKYDVGVKYDTAANYDANSSIDAPVLSDTTPTRDVIFDSQFDASNVLDQTVSHLDQSSSMVDVKKFDVALPTPTGQVLISELMINPTDAADNAEWFELYNPSNSPIDINGWIIKDTKTNIHTINNSGPLNIPAQGYLVLARQEVVTSGVTVPYQYLYSNLYLANSSDDLQLWNGAVLVDSISWNSTSWTITSGRSFSLKASAYAANILTRNMPASWCLEANGWTGSGSDKGTPGAAPSCN